MLPSRLARRLFPLLALAAVTACGGTVVAREDGGDGGGGSSNVGSASGPSASGSPTGQTGTGSASGGSTGATGSGVSTTSVGSSSSGDVVSSSTGSVGCTSHDDCTGDICQFFTGTCIRRCDEDGSCGTREICDECASSSCPQCADCIGGCVPTWEDVCDSHDDCAAGDLCIFSWEVCMPACSADGTCPAGYACTDCATSSCPGCRDCTAACLPLED